MHDISADGRSLEPGNGRTKQDDSRGAGEGRRARFRAVPIEWAIWILAAIAVIAPPAPAQTIGPIDATASSLPAPAPTGTVVRAVPSPGTAVLLGAGLAVAAGRRRRSA